MCLLIYTLFKKTDNTQSIIRTSLKVFNNIIFVFIISTTFTPAKLFKTWMYILMSFQCSSWTFTGRTHLHTFMSKYMSLKVNLAAEFLLTNVTSEPSTFIVWCTFKLFLSTAYSAVLNKATWLSESFATNSAFKRFLSTVNSAVPNKVTWMSKSFATNSAFKRLLSTVNSAVLNKDTWLTESFATNSTFKRFLSTVNSAVPNKVTWFSK